MEKKTPRDPLLPFDELTMPGDLYLLKLLLPFIPAHMRMNYLPFLLNIWNFPIPCVRFRDLPGKIALHSRISNFFQYIGSGQLRQIPPVGNDDADVFHVRK